MEDYFWPSSVDLKLDAKSVGNENERKKKKKYQRSDSRDFYISPSLIFHENYLLF